MEQLFSGARLVELVIVITLVEGLALAWYHRRTRRGVRPRDYGLNLLSGLCLMLALRSALVGAGTLWMACWLLAAGLFHGTDLWRRWR